jgi:16S rRNA (guanine(966)-N(2))-methyltransferase RsmD
VRIIGGQGRGRRLKAPKGSATRPTGDRVKQSLFDILTPRIAGARFLDACAGAGGIGLEALSRGAARVVFVDTDRAAIAAINENLEALGAPAEVQVFRQDVRMVLATLADTGVRFDIVYLDPPYDSPLYEEVLEQIGRTGVLRPEGLVVAEHFHKRALPATIGGLVHTREVRIGDHRLSFYQEQRE